MEAYSIRGVSLRDYIQQATTGDANAIERYIAGTLIVEQVLALQASQEILYGDGDGGVIKRELPRLREAIEQGAYRRLLPAYMRRFLENSTPLVNIGFTGSLDGFFCLSPVEGWKSGLASAVLNSKGIPFRKEAILLQ